jgi:hypothetical protein
MEEKAELLLSLLFNCMYALAVRMREEGCIACTSKLFNKEGKPVCAHCGADRLDWKLLFCTKSLQDRDIPLRNWGQRQ